MKPRNIKTETLMKKLSRNLLLQHQHSIKNLYLILNQSCLIMYLKDSKTVVIKIGSSLLVDEINN